MAKPKQMPMTPRMRDALADLLAGQDLDFDKTRIGRPTKQRLAKWGLAEFLRDWPTGGKDWDGPMALTSEGRRLADVQALDKRGK